MKTVAKVGVAPVHLLCIQRRNISPRRCPNPLQFIVFDSETVDKPVSLSIEKIVHQLLH
jgi:hypothetical protein